jgi:hypothetical protein
MLFIFSFWAFWNTSSPLPNFFPTTTNSFPNKLLISMNSHFTILSPVKTQFEIWLDAPWPTNFQWCLLLPVLFYLFICSFVFILSCFSCDRRFFSSVDKLILYKWKENHRVSKTQNNLTSITPLLNERIFDFPKDFSLINTSGGEEERVWCSTCVVSSKASIKKHLKKIDGHRKNNLR